MHACSRLLNAGRAHRSGWLSGWMCQPHGFFRSLPSYYATYCAARLCLQPLPSQPASLWPPPSLLLPSFAGGLAGGLARGGSSLGRASSLVTHHPLGSAARHARFRPAADLEDTAAGPSCRPLLPSASTGGSDGRDLGAAAAEAGSDEPGADFAAPATLAGALAAQSLRTMSRAVSHLSRCALGTTNKRWRCQRCRACGAAWAVHRLRASTCCGELLIPDSAHNPAN